MQDQTMAALIDGDEWRKSEVLASLPPFFLRMSTWTYYDLVGICWGRPIYRRREDAARVGDEKGGG